MFIEIIKKDATNIITETAEKKLYTIEWIDLINNKNKKMISEYVYFNCILHLKYKNIKKEPKVIFLGEYNDKFWFFKIIKKIKNNNYKFFIKKPVYDSIKDVKIFIIDWYDVIKDIKFDKFELEYAVGDIL